MSNTVAESSEVRQLVVFKLGNESFCVDIAKVREINRLVDITNIPESPEFVEGVINLRGMIIPIIDLRKRFRLKAAIENRDRSETRIMVVETAGNVVGFIVDAVYSVLRIRSDQIGPTPEIVTAGIDRKYIEGVATVDDELLIIVDSDYIFGTKELHAIQEISEN